MDKLKIQLLKKSNVMGKTLLTLIKNKIKKLKLERRYGEHNDQNIKDYCHCFVIKLEILMKQYSCSK